MKQMLSPRTARHARLFRLARSLTGTSGVPLSDGERIAWVNSHIKRDADM